MIRSGTISESARIKELTMVWVIAFRPTTGAGGMALTTLPSGAVISIGL